MLHLNRLPVNLSLYLHIDQANFEVNCGDTSSMWIFHQWYVCCWSVFIDLIVVVTLCYCVSGSVYSNDHTFIWLYCFFIGVFLFIIKSLSSLMLRLEVTTLNTLLRVWILADVHMNGFTCFLSRPVVQCEAFWMVYILCALFICVATQSDLVLNCVDKRNALCYRHVNGLVCLQKS